MVIFLSGYPHLGWIQLIRDRDQQPIIQLGYPIYSSLRQLKGFFDELLTKIVEHVHILKGRHLSIAGKGLITNTLLISKLWHVLRVIPASSTWIKKVKLCVTTYNMPFWPRSAWITMCRSEGCDGHGIIDIQQQPFLLHMTYVQQILKKHKTGFQADVSNSHSSVHWTFINTANHNVSGQAHTRLPEYGGGFRITPTPRQEYVANSSEHILDNCSDTLQQERCRSTCGSHLSPSTK